MQTNEESPPKWEDTKPIEAAPPKWEDTQPLKDTTQDTTNPQQVLAPEDSWASTDTDELGRPLTPELKEAEKQTLPIRLGVLSAGVPAPAIIAGAGLATRIGTGLINLANRAGVSSAITTPVVNAGVGLANVASRVSSSLPTPVVNAGVGLANTASRAGVSAATGGVAEGLTSVANGKNLSDATEAAKEGAETGAAWSVGIDAALASMIKGGELIKSGGRWIRNHAARALTKFRIPDEVLARPEVQKAIDESTGISSSLGIGKSFKDKMAGQADEAANAAEEVIKKLPQDPIPVSQVLPEEQLRTLDVPDRPDLRPKLESHKQNVRSSLEPPTFRAAREEIDTVNQQNVNAIREDLHQEALRKQQIEKEAIKARQEELKALSKTKLDEANVQEALGKMELDPLILAREEALQKAKSLDDQAILSAKNLHDEGILAKKTTDEARFLEEQITPLEQELQALKSKDYATLKKEAVKEYLSTKPPKTFTNDLLGKLDDLKNKREERIRKEINPADETHRTQRHLRAIDRDIDKEREALIKLAGGDSAARLAIKAASEAKKEANRYANDLWKNVQNRRRELEQELSKRRSVFKKGVPGAEPTPEFVPPTRVNESKVADELNTPIIDKEKEIADHVQRLRLEAQDIANTPLPKSIKSPISVIAPNFIPSPALTTVQDAYRVANMPIAKDVNVIGDVIRPNIQGMAPEGIQAADDAVRRAATMREVADAARPPDSGLERTFKWGAIVHLPAVLTAELATNPELRHILGSGTERLGRWGSDLSRAYASKGVNGVKAMVSILNQTDPEFRKAHGESTNVSPYTEVKKEPVKPVRAELPPEKFYEGLGNVESNGKYDATNPNSSAAGKYQFLWDTHRDRVNKWYGRGKATKEAFLASPLAQERVMINYDAEVLTPEANNLKQTVPNAASRSLTELKALIHFKGVEGAREYLTTGIDRTKKNNMNIESYLNKIYGE